jgi:hypothetical protein
MCTSPKELLIEVKPGYFNRWFERIFYRYDGKGGRIGII